MWNLIPALIKGIQAGATKALALAAKTGSTALGFAGKGAGAVGSMFGMGGGEAASTISPLGMAGKAAETGGKAALGGAEEVAKGGFLSGIKGKVGEALQEELAKGIVQGIMGTGEGQQATDTGPTTPGQIGSYNTVPMRGSGVPLAFGQRRRVM